VGSFAGYTLVDRLGAGAFGEVHRARGADGREVALKVLRPEVVDKDMRARFQREARLGMELDHPRVVKTLDAGEHEGRLYLVTELVPGGCLAGLLQRAGPLDLARATGRVRDLLEALAALHARGLVHRDVKPSNLLLGGDGRAKLADLGLARSVDQRRTLLTLEGMILGTPVTMAPEQADGSSELDIRCDLYAAGCVLFMALTGRAPFEGTTALEIVRGHLERTPPDLRALRADTPVALSQLVAALLQKDPAARPRDPAEALRRLDAAMPPPPAPPVDGPTASTRGGPAREEPFVPRTLPDAPRAAALETPRTLPDAPRGTPQAPFVPRTLPDRPAAPRAVPLTIDDRAPSLGSAPTTPPRASTAGPAVEREGGPATLTRARLTWTGADGVARHLFVYGGATLRGGRDGLERADQDVCLRLLPSQAHAEQNKRISGQHLQLDLDQDGAWVTDLGSTGGTWLGGARLAPKVRARLAPGAPTPLSVAQALTLEARAAAGHVLLTRRDNATGHAYLLLDGACALSLEADGPRPAASGDVGLLWADGGLWLGRGEWPRWRATPLVVGDFEGQVSVARIDPRDQKG
jgi:serine/threonine-protein kinase